MLIIAIIGFAVFVGLRTLLAKRNLTVRQFFVIYFATMVGIALAFLAITGRMHPVFGLLGAVLPFLFRSVGLLLQGAQFAAMYKSLKGALGGGPSAAPATSEIQSRFVHMVLYHDTGKMDGKVLEGQFKDALLSQLSQQQLHTLVQEVSVDPDSHHLLLAYLEREHGEWRDEEKAEPANAPSGEMTESEALDILGLQPGADRKAVKEAHRRMMQKVHPDRGGSTYLATKINAAKDFLESIYSA